MFFGWDYLWWTVLWYYCPVQPAYLFFVVVSNSPVSHYHPCFYPTEWVLSNTTLSSHQYSTSMLHCYLLFSLHTIVQLTLTLFCIIFQTASRRPLICLPSSDKNLKLKIHIIRLFLSSSTTTNTFVCREYLLNILCNFIVKKKISSLPQKKNHASLDVYASGCLYYHILIAFRPKRHYA